MLRSRRPFASPRLRGHVAPGAGGRRRDPVLDHPARLSVSGQPDARVVVLLYRRVHRSTTTGKSSPVSVGDRRDGLSGGASSILDLVFGYPFAYILIRKIRYREFVRTMMTFPLFGPLYLAFGLFYILLPNGPLGPALHDARASTSPSTSSRRLRCSSRWRSSRSPSW